MLTQLLLKELDTMATQEQMADRVLTAEDRCDACSAAAKVIATFLNGELMFCGHHAKELRISLSSKSVSVYDPDELLIFSTLKHN
jgi:hypothetical protein